MLSPSPYGMSRLVVRALGIYPTSTGFVIQGWSRHEQKLFEEEGPISVKDIDAGRRTIQELLGSKAALVRFYDPAPIEVWGITST